MTDGGLSKNLLNELFRLQLDELLQSLLLSMAIKTREHVEEAESLAIEERVGSRAASNEDDNRTGTVSREGGV